MATVHGVGNEKALKHVIDAVNGLCDEISKTSECDTGTQIWHLQLTANQLLDQLEMPGVEHAKHEVALLAQLQKSLTRLIEFSEKALESSETAERLKKFRQELQQVFKTPSGGMQKGTETEMVTPPLSSRISEAQTISTLGLTEQTETPTKEACRPSHEKDGPRPLIELRVSTLPPPVKSSEPSSDATKTPTPGERNPPEERSQIIWTDEEPCKGPPADMKRAVETTVTGGLPSLDGKNDVTRKPKSAGEKGGSGAKPKADQITVPGDKPRSQNLSEARSVKAKLIDFPQMVEVSEVGQEEEVSAPWIWGRVLGLGITVLVLPFVLVWSLLIVLNFGNRRMNAGMIGWQMACNMANAFCENYGVMCIDYCVSGLQLDKWQHK